MNISLYSSAVSRLENSLEEGTLSNAYLFSGSDAYGKLAAALALARSLERHEPFASSWDSVWNDAEFWKSGGANYSLVDARVFASDLLGIDDAREIRDFVLIRPLVSSRRTVIIPSAQKLTASAQQALLKVSEDASRYSLIIFIAPEKEALLETLLSRCAHVYFKNPDETELAVAVKQKNTHARSDGDEILRLGQGIPGRCMTLLHRPEELERVKELAKKIEFGSFADLMAIGESIETDADLDEFFRGLIRRVRIAAGKDASLRTAMLLEYRTFCAQLGSSFRTQLEAAIITALAA